MNRSTVGPLLLMLLGASGLAFAAWQHPGGFGKVYVERQEFGGPGAGQVRFQETLSRAPGALWSPSRTIGLWIAAFFTLAVFSYLYRDNVAYKLAEAVVVGTSAGYTLVTSFWEGICGQLIAGLVPDLARATFLPSLSKGETPNYWLFIPLLLGMMLFARYVPRLGALASWPMALIIGVTAGLKLVLVLDADFISQIRATIVPLVVFADGRFDFWNSLRNLTLVLSVFSCLTYFLFSFEHKGVVGRVSRIGIWVLMITFGASFAFTVMGRITLLTMRLQFLLDEWLWVIDPSGRRGS